MSNNNNYAKLFESLGVDQVVKDTITEFINTYDGTNKDEFNRLVALLVILLGDYAVVSEKAKGLDELNQMKEDFTIKVEKLKENYYRLINHKDPIAPFHTRGTE